MNGNRAVICQFVHIRSFEQLLMTSVPTTLLSTQLFYFKKATRFLYVFPALAVLYTRTTNCASLLVYLQALRTETVVYPACVGECEARRLKKYKKRSTSTSRFVLASLERQNHSYNIRAMRPLLLLLRLRNCRNTLVERTGIPSRARTCRYLLRGRSTSTT